MEDSVLLGEGTARGPQLAGIDAVRELKLSSMVNICESLQRRHENKPNDADRLEPKGAWPGTNASNSSVADVAAGIGAAPNLLGCLCGTW